MGVDFLCVFFITYWLTLVYVVNLLAAVYILYVIGVI